MKKRWIKKVPLVIAIATLGVFVFSSIVMLLWNGILPAVLHVSAITFWQAAGILLLAKILFGGFRGKRAMGCGWRRKAMYMKWQNMTPEEKEQFKEYKCC
jgi:Ca2+/H+ antiporter, TMEM165/GDT1 family